MVHAVNAQSGTPILPLRDIVIELRLEQGEQVAAVTAEPTKQQLDFDQRGDRVSISIPEVPLHQVAVVQLA